MYWLTHCECTVQCLLTNANRTTAATTTIKLCLTPKVSLTPLCQTPLTPALTTDPLFSRLPGLEFLINWIMQHTLCLLTSLSRHRDSEMRPGGMDQWPDRFPRWVVLHCMDIPHCVHSSLTRWTSERCQFGAVVSKLVLTSARTSLCGYKFFASLETPRSKFNGLYCCEYIKNEKLPNLAPAD